METLKHPALLAENNSSKEQMHESFAVIRGASPFCQSLISNIRNNRGFGELSNIQQAYQLEAFVREGELLRHEVQLIEKEMEFANFLHIQAVLDRAREEIMVSVGSILAAA